MDCKIQYIGVFPPPLGGVTVKNVMVADMLNDIGIPTTRINLIGSKICLGTIKTILNQRKTKFNVIGLDTKRLIFFLKIQSIFKKSLKKDVILLMGGIAAKIISKDPQTIKRLKSVKMVLVETNGMREELKKVGISNVAVFPNCKKSNGCRNPKISKAGDQIRLVYFSLICKDKGIDCLFDSIEKLNSLKVDYSLDIYGRIDPDIEKFFKEQICRFEKVTYKGIFDSSKDDVYKKLNEYDILLFPSKWKAEGVPGVLVEAKMSGIGIVASDIAYNSEIVNQDNNEGIIVKQNDSDALTEAIVKLYYNKDLLNEIKKNSYKSRIRYSIEEYSDLLKNILN